MLDLEMFDTIFNVVSILFIVFFVAYVIFLILRTRNLKNNQIKIPEIIPVTGFKIPVFDFWSAPRGSKKLPSDNSESGTRLDPLFAKKALELFPDKIKYIGIKNFFPKSCFEGYDAIHSIDILEQYGLEAIIISFKNESIAFYANLSNKLNLIELIRFFKSKKITISNDAENLIKEVL